MVLDQENTCLVCLKNLVTIVSGKKVTSRRRDLNSYKSHLSELKELFPEIVCQSRKIFICEECFNKFQKYLRAQGKLNSAKAEFEHEKNAFVSLHSTHTLRQKRTLGTPQRPRNPPKQFVCDQRSPSKIPVLILPQHGPGKENVPHPETKLAAFRQSFQKDGHSSPSTIPVPSQTKITEKKQDQRGMKSRKMLVLSEPSLSTQENTNVESEIQKCQLKAAPNFKAHIQYTYPSQSRKKIVDENETYLKLVRAMIDERPLQIATAVCKDQQIRASDIEDISVVRQMPNLEVCSVSVNDISILEDFSHCPNLQELYIRNNKIEDLRQICYLKDLEKLRILWLADNPCATAENYRYTVLRNLPGLQKLDNVVVQDEERLKAEEEGEELSLPESIEDNPPHTPSENGDILTPTTPDKELNPKDPVTLSWEETNKIREQLGLKPLPIDKMTTPKSAPTSATRHRNAHILQAVLILVKELDRDSLEIVDTAIKKRLDSL